MSDYLESLEKQADELLKERPDEINKLADEIEKGGFLSNLQQRPTTIRNLRNIFQRARPTSQELRTLHGAVRNLVDKRKD